MSTQEMTVNGRAILIERADKLLYPNAGITKGDLADYYRGMAETMLPHMRDRPLTMQRFPDGINASGFYQKEAPDYFPERIRRVSIHFEKEGAAQDQVICKDAATLLYLTNQACITPHIWLSRADEWTISSGGWARSRIHGPGCCDTAVPSPSPAGGWTKRWRRV